MIMHRTIRTICALVLAISCAGSPALAKSTDTRFEAQNFERLPDPGAAPALGSFDYRPYLTTVLGNTTIAGRVSFTLNDGERMVCNHADDVYLYPDTLFTRWVIVKWAVLVDRKRIVPSPRYLAGITFPQWLDVLGDDRSIAVRTAGCDDAGNFAFRQVPPGHYFVETMVTRYGGPISSGGDGDVVEYQTPTGLQDGITPSKTFGGRQPSDDYILVSKFPIIVRDRTESTFTMTPDDLKTISHSFEK